MSPKSESDPADRSRSPRREIGGKKFRVGSGDTYVPFRSRTRRRRRIIAGSAVGLLVAAAGIYGVVSLIGAPAPAPAAAACPAGVARPAAVALPSPAEVTVNVYNASNRHGLAAATASLLKQRGFTIGKVTNDPLKENLTIAAQIRGGAVGSADMRVVAAEVPGAQLQPDSRGDSSVDLVLGAGFTALSAPQQVATTLHATATTAPAQAGCRT
jgi:LytR cell envelope-related transcriptional attenuator